MLTDKTNIDSLIEEMSIQLKNFLLKGERNNPVIMGIRTGGTWIAERLKDKLDIGSPLGELNIAFYRDDFSQIGMHPRVTPSNLPFNVEKQHVILVDDVLHTGRTIRAAMNEIFDYGRPASICLTVLVERNGRELPIQAGIVGKFLELKANEHVKLLGPGSLALEIKTAG